ncbi:putative protein isoform X1 [Capsicum annuum]|uniref:uncharacterized protein LOC107870812 isoform X1 n=2 Tax=Capsicum annuum TaxID=4072 RepID=UPI0007BF0530|nr:uncharacterized protein LOC107870812 isoform X1 [Capsicum annuum]
MAVSSAVSMNFVVAPISIHRMSAELSFQKVASSIAVSSAVSMNLAVVSRELFSPSPQPLTSNSWKRRGSNLKVRAKLVCFMIGGGEGDVKNDGKKKFITKEEEPEQYWQSAGERAGENPMKTPLPYIIIFGMSTPFVILAVAFANGWIKVPIR